MNVLAVGAHFDDVELGCGGTLARHIAQGDRVWAFIATRSEITDPRQRTVRTAATAEEEGRRALALLGVTLVTGDLPTFGIEFNEELNRRLLPVIEEHAIDTVYTHWPGDAHHDHRALALATLHCARHVPRLAFYRSNWYDTGEPFAATLYSDITAHWARKEAALHAHASELERTDRQWLPYFRREAENAGRRVGVELAEAFAVVRWLLP